MTGNNHDDDRTWTVPLTWSTKQEPNFDDVKPKQYLSEVSAQVELTGVEAGDWVVVNNQHVGYYMVHIFFFFFEGKIGRVLLLFFKKYKIYRLFVLLWHIDRIMYNQQISWLISSRKDNHKNYWQFS